MGHAGAQADEERDRLVERILIGPPALEGRVVDVGIPRHAHSGSIAVMAGVYSELETESPSRCASSSSAWAPPATFLVPAAVSSVAR